MMLFLYSAVQTSSNSDQYDARNGGDTAVVIA